MKTIILNQEDINTATHPFLWAEMLEELLGDDKLPESRADYPESVMIRVAAAEAL
jgi:hypothetical protein